jgi:hypothetical protein
MSVEAATRWVSTKPVGLFLMPAREIAALTIPMTYGMTRFLPIDKEEQLVVLLA